MTNLNIVLVSDNLGDHGMDSIPTEEQPVSSTAPLTIPPPPISHFETVHEALPYSDARPVWYVIFMYLITFGLYEVVWLYRAWRTLLMRYQLKGNAVINAIFSPLCAWSFFRYIFDIAQQAGYNAPLKYGMVATIYFCIQAIGFIFDFVPYVFHDMSTAIVNTVLFTSFALNLIPLYYGIVAMNAGYSLINPDKRMRTTLSPWSIVITVIASIIIFILIIASLLMLNHEVRKQMEM